MIIQLSRMLHVPGTHELMCRKSYRMVKLRISVSEMIYILKRVFQLVSILHGAVVITLQTVSHFAVQRVSCVMIQSEATMVIAKGRTTNLGRGVYGTPFTFFRFSFILDFLLFTSFCFSSFSLSLCPLILLLLLYPFFISCLLFFLLCTLVFFWQVYLISLFVSCFSFFSVYPLFVLQA